MRNTLYTVNIESEKYQICIIIGYLKTWGNAVTAVIITDEQLLNITQ